MILLDQAPSSIEKPTTPHGLGLSLLGIQKNGGALELAPFWLTVHPKLSAEKMYKNRFPALYHFSLSGATVKSDSTNFYSCGIRTRIFQTYGKKKLNRLDSLRSAMELALADLDTVLIRKLQKEYMSTIEHPVLSVDLAAASGAYSLSNSFDDLYFSRWAIWISTHWRPKGEDFFISFLGRYINSEKLSEQRIYADLVDVGTRLNYDFKRIGLSLEYLQRFDLTNSVYEDYRLAIIGSFMVNKNLYLTSTFGKNFGEVNNIIALAGINFGFSKNKVKAY